MTDYDAEIEDFEFFNLRKDPYEQNNIVTKKRKKALELKDEFDKTYKELITSENLINPQKIIVGSEHENPITLNRNDAGGERGIWAKEEVFGKWDVRILSGIYNGKGGHAALPHLLNDPVLMCSQIITSLQQIISRNNKPNNPSVAFLWLY